MWNPFRSKLAAAILGGIDKIHMDPGSKVLYLGAASGTSVSHVADIIGPVSIACAESLFFENRERKITDAHIRARLVHNCQLGVEVLPEQSHARFLIDSSFTSSEKTCVQKFHRRNVSSV